MPKDGGIQGEQRKTGSQVWWEIASKKKTKTEREGKRGQ